MTIEKTNKYLSFAADEYGAELHSIKLNGKELLWQAGDAWKRHAPILFPFICSPAERKYRAKGVEYTMPSNHGFARDSRFTLSDEGADHAEFTLCSSDETKNFYPYDFRLTVRYTLSGSSVEAKHIVKNLGTEDMYFYLGGHPAFICDIEGSECYVEYEKPETIVQTFEGVSRTVLDGESRLRLTRELFDRDVILKDKPDSESISLVKLDGGYVKLRFPDSDCIAVWTAAKDKNAQFICLEPWTSVPVYADDEFPDIENKPHAIKLAPDAEFTYRYIIEAGENV